ncbi:MAG: hypothetical protein QGH60_00330 [Phycisphaerae bacterium]|jgi:hypothetical protein|nr:hypothetical protein [Phycisphaerae bacterium]
MKSTLLVLVTAIFGIVLPASALDIKAITAKPTAHNPQFDNKTAWGELAGDEYFLKEKWAKARVLIWAGAGKAVKRGAPRIDPLSPVNWIDAATGKPADALPDMDTDVILPDADKPYKVAFKGQKNRACRHLTVGKNAAFAPGGGGSLSVFGNVWIRPGGGLYIYRTLKLTGSGNTFFRNDWPADGALKRLHDTGAIVTFDPANPRKPNPWSWRTNRAPSICHFFVHDKPKGSTEMIGYSSSRDEVGIKAGRLIVGRDSRFLCGGAANLDVAKGAAITLMDGAMTGKTVNQFGICCKMHGGEITAGLPDRPIERDARLGIGYSNWMNLSFPDQAKGRRGNAYDYGRFSGGLTGKLIGYPAKGSDARLVVGWQRISPGGGGRGVKATDDFNQRFARLAPKITLWIGAETEIANVRFEDVHRGGIVLQDAGTAAKWKNVTYGDGCLSKDPKELIRQYKGKTRRGRPVEPLKPEKKYISM